MIYTPFQDKKLPKLGFGGMRLPVGADGSIDEEKANELIEHALDNGVNFFDTSYFYHGGESQRFLGRSLNRFPRESWYLATKMPGNMVRVTDDGMIELSGMGMKPRMFKDAAEIFEFQLSECGVEYFDFYLLHNIAENTFDTYTDKNLGIVEYLREQKRNGRIRHLGFSAHGRAETIGKFLDIYNGFEFAMIQINYLDWTIQDAGKKYELLTQHNIPVFAMEPVRGGKLANMNEEACKLLRGARPDDSDAAWAFRFLTSFPNMCTVFSGMSSLEQLKENIEIFSKNEPLTEGEREVLNKVVGTVTELVPCTDCKYCASACPIGLDIPKLLTMYNEAGYEVSWSLNTVLRTMTEAEKPAACIGCGVCEPLCPQGIGISEALSKFASVLNK